MENNTSALVQQLGRKYSELKKRMEDFRLLTSPVSAEEVFGQLAHIRQELIRLEAAHELSDGSIIIKSEFIVGFLEPTYSKVAHSKRTIPDISDPKVVERIALTCGLNQWLFIANQIPDAQAREDFLSACALIVSTKMKKDEQEGIDGDDE